MPGLTARITRQAVDGASVWTEWVMSGARRDGSWHELRGVIIFGVEQERVASARFYLEPLDAGPGTYDDVVRQQVVR